MTYSLPEVCLALWESESLGLGVREPESLSLCFILVPCGQQLGKCQQPSHQDTLSENQSLLFWTRRLVLVIATL